MAKHNSHVLNHYHFGYYRGDGDGNPDSLPVNAANEETDYISQYAPMLYEALYGKSPEEKAALLRNRIQTLESMKAATPGLAFVYDPQIERAKLLLEALEGQVYEQQETRAFSTFYKIGGLIVLIGVPSAMIYALIQFGKAQESKG